MAVSSNFLFGTVNKQPHRGAPAPHKHTPLALQPNQRAEGSEGARDANFSEVKRGAYFSFSFEQTLQ